MAKTEVNGGDLNADLVAQASDLTWAWRFETLKIVTEP